MVFQTLSILKPPSLQTDTTLIKSDESLQALELKVNQNLKLKNDRFTANKLTLNAGKTKVMLFSHRIVTEPTNFAINNIKIEQLGEAYKKKFTEFLGFHLDKNLWCKYNHIEESFKWSIHLICHQKSAQYKK